jgi:hypothetical protein
MFYVTDKSYIEFDEHREEKDAALAGTRLCRRSMNLRKPTAR